MMTALSELEIRTARAIDTHYEYNNIEGNNELRGIRVSAEFEGASIVEADIGESLYWTVKYPGPMFRSGQWLLTSYEIIESKLPGTRYLVSLNSIGPVALQIRGLNP